MPDKNLVNQKLSAINLYLEELKPILKLGYKDFSKSYKDFRTAERDFQLIVDSAVDINMHFILEKGINPPDNNFQSFVALGEAGILPKGFIKDIAPSAGLRNRLVHEYEKINPQIFYNSLKKFLPLYSKYVKDIYKLA